MYFKQKIKKALRKRESFYDFGGSFLDGFLPKNHIFIKNSLKRKRLRIYIGISFILILFFTSAFLFLWNLKDNFFLITFYFLIFLLFSFAYNFITRFRYFEFFLWSTLFFGIGINVYSAIKQNTFPPFNYNFFLIFIVLIHFIWNRWASLLFTTSTIFFKFFLLLEYQTKTYQFEQEELLFRYFYNYVLSSLILWFLLEIYEHFKEELEIKLKEINLSREKDLELAKEIQSQLYPAIPKSEKFYFDYFIQPFDKVSGDYLEIIDKTDTIWIILADVTGHGLQSGMLTMQINTLVNYLIVEKNIEDIVEIYFEINAHYYKILQKLSIKNFANFTIIKLQTNGRIQITGNLNMVYLIRKEENKIYSFKEPTPLLGMMLLPKSKIIYKEIDLKKNDILFIFTDGFFELFRKENTLTEEKFEIILKEFFNQNYEDLKIENLIRNIQKKFNNLNYNDDISSILIQKK